MCGSLHGPGRLQNVAVWVRTYTHPVLRGQSAAARVLAITDTAVRVLAITDVTDADSGGGTDADNGGGSVLRAK